jgi:hypothetical protein
VQVEGLGSTKINPAWVGESTKSTVTSARIGNDAAGTKSCKPPTIAWFLLSTAAGELPLTVHAPADAGVFASVMQMVLDDVRTAIPPRRTVRP